MLNPNLSQSLTDFCEYLVNTARRDLAISQDIEAPEVKVFDGATLPGEDSDSVGAYDPAENEILLANDLEAFDWQEYGDYAGSPVIGSIYHCSGYDRLHYILLHELAHWMTDHVTRNYDHRHTLNFKVCYAYLRLRAKTLQ